MKKEREIIEFETKEEFFDAIYEEEEFYLIEEEECNFDSEKGMVDIDIVVQRASDKKFFRGSYIRGTAGNRWVNDLTMEEVFKKTIKTTVYE